MAGSKGFGNSDEERNIDIDVVLDMFLLDLSLSLSLSACLFVTIFFAFPAKAEIQPRLLWSVVFSGRSVEEKFFSTQRERDREIDRQRLIDSIIGQDGIRRLGKTY